jgi:hypothetical protein
MTTIVHQQTFFFFFFFSYHIASILVKMMIRLFFLERIHIYGKMDCFCRIYYLKRIIDLEVPAKLQRIYTPVRYFYFSVTYIQLHVLN